MVATPQTRRLTARLARAGFADPVRAGGLLTSPALRLWDSERNEASDPAAAAVLSALGRAAAPDQALAMLAELAVKEPGPEIVAELRNSVEFRTRLLGVLGVSQALAEHLCAHPGDALLLRGAAGELPGVDSAAERLADAVGASAADPVTGTAGTPATVTGPAAVRALRAAYRRELLLVAARDLASELSLQEVTEALADLAGFVLSAGLAVARAGLPPDAAGCRLAVIGMGKAGGRELNYISDVDVVFVFEPAATGTAKDADQESAALATATRLAADTMRICGQAAWEVDAALRPEGKSGALVRTLASHEAYYKRWASTWEFQALLKARPIAGDLELGERYVQALSPLVWTASQRPDFVPDVQAMRRRVVEHLPADLAEREIKLGRGGLRDVEFAVQLLQLVHGRADPSLQVRATLPALAALRDGGFVGRDDAVSLADAYQFLRATEHRLQLVKLRRTHLVPDDPAAMLRLARSLGFRPDSRGDAVAVWRAEWALHAREVRRLHEKLFYRPLLEAVARVPAEALRLTAGEARRRLEALGYTDPQGALRHIEALTAGLSRRAALQRALLPVILSELADAPDPDAGLLAYRQVSDALGSTSWFLRLLRDEGAVASRLATLLGTSRYVANLLVRSPEALQMLSADDQLRPRRQAELEVLMGSAAGRQDDLAQAAHAIRSLRRVELLRIAFADLLGQLGDIEVAEALSELADATLAAALSAVQRIVAAEQAVPELGVRFAVVAMGRLGGRELGYGSDADVLFVFSDCGAGAEAGRRAHLVAERLRAMLAAPSTDPPLRLDADLRPEGRNGVLVRSLDSYAEYYQRWASVWEAQALLRARFCAGDPELGERFIALIEPLRYPAGGLAGPAVVEIRRIKGRVDAERLPRGADPHTHTKLGRGGLADVEWTVQLLQLRFADQVPGLRTTGTLAAMQAAVEAGKLAADDAAALVAAWRLAGRIRNAIMLVRDKAEDQLPKPGRVLEAVGRVLGYQPGFEAGQLIDDYRKVARRARRVVESVFYDPAG
ncbi:bifunctional [glutamine synthetase] adenylyltransferase/[glutamine synthetase]-adenylyl-L-tyrosine phosphorylase [Jatrophihabitans sp.]|jgi:glutamate-ammonia-ligase adenylyltransferase|uniref:bifunctional [glutamine synthetase] adenylyltransferase/[glutamine synthetase]-adenylyl-L-tyrosine phosphorylase n=1 Tax=Jatrophihabitans sp. TaxID=1932789 RepID=UPI0038CDB8C8